MLFGPECIFCGKEGRQNCYVQNQRTKESTTKFTLDSWQKYETMAEERGDFTLLRKIKGVDLFAAEACFHPTCRNKFVRSTQRGCSKSPTTVMQQTDMMSAHNDAFDKLIVFVEEHIIAKKEIIQQSSLRLIYVARLNETKFPNSAYRSDKLMRRL